MTMASHGVPRVSGAVPDKSEATIEEERKQIEQYKTLERSVQDKIRVKDYSNTTLQLTSKLLARNPEYYTIWNNRRLILQEVFSEELTSPGDSSADTKIEAGDAAAAEKAGLTLAQQEIALLIKEDLQFLLPLLKQYPKCYWIWNHRAWLLGVATKHLPIDNAVQLWQGELGLVSKMLALDSRNYHGWGYRRIAVSTIESLTSSSMVESEFEYTTKMINTNLSNFSAWHNRSKLLPRLMNERRASSEDRTKAFGEEFKLITRALYTDPYDQSLWVYHQYLISTLDAGNTQAPELLAPCSNAHRETYLEQELDSVREMLDGAEDCKYIYQALLDLSRRYLELKPSSTKITTAELTEWLDQLQEMDPLRAGRWVDLTKTMKL